MAAMRYINAQIDGVKQQVIYKRRKARQAKLAGASASSYSFNPSHNDDPEDTAPLVPRAGGADGYARVSMDDVGVHAPRPAHTNPYVQQQPIPTFAPPRSPSPPTTPTIAPQGPSQLLTALLARLPDATNRTMIDQAAVDFAFLNSKAARKRLIKAGALPWSAPLR